jgi:hypothetical protein
MVRQEVDGGWTERTLEPHDSSVSGLEAIDLLLSGGESLGGNDGAESLLDDVPQLLVLLLEQDYSAGSLRVEAGRSVLDSLVDDLDDLRVGDGRLGLEGVDGAAGTDGVEEGGRRHFASYWD